MRKALIFLFFFLAVGATFISRQFSRAIDPPNLDEGSYLRGQTLSVWPSWSMLGNALGRAFPSDPINRLGLAGTCEKTTNVFCVSDLNCPQIDGKNERCVFHDSLTGWSTVDRRFSFACPTSSYAYRYIASGSLGSYEVRAKLEDAGLTIDNWDQFIKDFVDTDKIILTDQGVCLKNEEISAVESGKCGDGRVNPDKGEQCDPPGYKNYDYSTCISSGDQMKVTECGTDCKWKTPELKSCKDASKCGNGKIDPGEACDDGAMNGRYNKCNTTCSGKVEDYDPSNPEGPPGSCGDSEVNPKYEICDEGGRIYWALAKENSCNWDCQTYGPYCGDKVVQPGSEECDGDKKCFVDGKSGLQKCSSDCKKISPLGKPRASWNFDSCSGGKITDLSGNGRTGMLENMRSCQEALSQGRGVLALDAINSSSQWSSMAVNDTAGTYFSPLEFTVDVWVKPVANQTRNNQMIYTFGTNAKWYGLSMSKEGFVTFKVTKGNVFYPVTSIGKVALGDWTRVTVTYKYIDGKHVMAVYLNSKLDTTKEAAGIEILPMSGSQQFLVGRFFGTGPYTLPFDGKIDDLAFFAKYLTELEIASLIGSDWPCEVGATEQTPTSSDTTCGDGKVDSDEACDKGAENGKACSASYGKPCTYCSTDCQNVVEVQPTEYCGNGKIEGTEQCEIVGEDIYVVAKGQTTVSNYVSSVNGYRELKCEEEAYTSTSSVREGDKQCASCSLVRNCITCGENSIGGVKVGGSFINVLETRDPLYKEKGFGNLKLQISGTNWCKKYESNDMDETAPRCLDSDSYNIGSHSVSDIANLSYILKDSKGKDALIESSPVCSAGSKEYKLRINDNRQGEFDFQVVSAYDSNLYDLVLSPVIKNGVRPRDVRVVVSWVGSGDFYSGFVRQVPENPILEGSSYSGYEGTKLVNYHATTTDYYSGVFTDSKYKKTGIWYHGFKSSNGQKNEESFTLDTSLTPENLYAYSFYVRTAGNAIQPYKSSAKLRVDIYLPQNYESPYHFSAPSKTYYFNTAAPSDNASAEYWQVFNLIIPTSTNPVSVNNLVEINTIVTGLSYFQFIGACTGRPSGSICRAGGGACDKAETCDGVSDYCPSDQKEPASKVCRAPASSCDPVEKCDGTNIDCPPDVNPCGGFPKGTLPKSTSFPQTNTSLYQYVAPENNTTTQTQTFIGTFINQ